MKKLLFSIWAICFFSLNIFAYEIPQKEKEILPINSVAQLHMQEIN